MPKYLSDIENKEGLTQEAQLLLSQFMRSSNSAPTPAARRSGRQRTGPINYYEKINLFAEQDSDENVSERSRNSSVAYRPRGGHSTSPLDPRPEPPRSFQHPQINDPRPDNPSSCRTSRDQRTLNGLLHGRELGNTSQQLHIYFAQDLKPSKHWQGASNDVIVLAWSPDGTRFAAGATAQSDEHNMEYNRGNNLVLGDLTRNHIKELPDHWVKCPWRRVTPGQNQTDTRLFMSVTAMQWFDDILFTSSYDNTVKLWDVSSHANAGCVGTLRHNSKVEVMARSNFDEQVLATGTDSIGLWNIKERKHTSLEFQQRQRKKDIELVPTSLAWGTIPATRNILLAGMSEKDEKDEGVPQNGLLAAWRMDEASMTPIHLSPNAQNIFDVKWHHSLPLFLTGSAPTPSRASLARSVVRLYDPLRSKMHRIELDCPALDINDVTFCPANPYYVTASCTDGVTYVWDYRKPEDILLRLGHDGPSEQIDESLPRERVDVGVRMALWGDGPDQFYSAASDAVLKRWDILRSQEDVHVDDVARFPGAVMCGAFSSDKTNLLIGDSAGGLHVLSSSPFQASDEQSMVFESSTEAIDDNGDQQEGSNSEAKMANNMLLGEELVRHPIYGVGKGPHYKGPFASWARPDSTPQHLIAETPLKEEVLVRQFDGAPLNDRRGLDEQSRKEIASRIQISRIRNQRRQENKRKRDGSTSSAKPISSSSNNFIDLCSSEEIDDEGPLLPRPIDRSKRHAGKIDDRVIMKTEPEIIDLTLESDPEEIASPSIFETVLGELEEDIEEDFWWPASGTIDPNFPKEGEED
ncbi:WD repeat protein [Aspergillus ruber CBS 135680]|uniref:WD40 repeat-like protein n=1 Tax=Aspergillus ruber (strain CBS 135680) TaxID=1388766 RepID=A0A017SHU0_ASPRC|nr:WD40 repeat-like protein [Aspergillus ruber CBS 135680]EYE95875.1 WD40 repeat-like protein [Aspergillus ruber CBS 135680]